MPAAVRAVRWPRPGTAELIEGAPVLATAGQAVVELAVSVSNPGTERARYGQLPNASVGFPHQPGCGGAGRITVGAPGFAVGALVAVRAAPHQSIVAAPPDRLHAVPAGVAPFDAALWQLGLIALHGLGMAGYTPGEPITVLGAGLIGALARRIALAQGSTHSRVLASSTAKAWTVAREPGTEFLTAADLAALAEADRHALVIDATGTGAGLAQAAACTADGGRLVLLGSPRTPRAEVPVRDIQQRGLRLVGAHIDTLPDASAASGLDLLARYTELYFGLLAAGRLSVADLITSYQPADAPLLYRQLVGDRSLVGAGICWLPAEPVGPAEPAEPAAAAGAAGASRLTVREPARPLGISIVGCGDIGSQNAEAVRLATGAHLVSCFDTAPALAADLAASMDVRCAASLAELLGDPAVEAVIVATPHDTHEQLALAVLAAGKHLLLQKPLAVDLASAIRIGRAAHRAAAITSVLLPGRYEPGYRLAGRARDAGLLGRPAGLTASYLVDKPASYYRGGYSNRAASSWRLSKARSGGGVLIMNLLHHLDVARSLLRAEADWVFADTLPSSHSAEIEDVAALTVRFGDTIATFVAAASVPGGPGEQLRIWGSRGHCVVLPDWQLTSSADRSGFDEKPGPAGEPGALALDGFADAVRRGRRPDVSLLDALAVQAIIEAGYQSARTGRPVRPAELWDGTL